MGLTKEQEVFQAIVHKSWEDAEFKAALIADPVNVIQEFTGKTINVPEGKSIEVKDQTDESVIYINIPAQQCMDDVELTEEQLEIIAGGGDPGVIIQSSSDSLNGIVGD